MGTVTSCPQLPYAQPSDIEAGFSCCIGKSWPKLSTREDRRQSQVRCGAALRNPSPHWIASSYKMWAQSIEFWSACISCSLWLTKVYQAMGLSSRKRSSLGPGHRAPCMNSYLRQEKGKERNFYLMEPFALSIGFPLWVCNFCSALTFGSASRD